ncbi:hypothetical protein L3X38_017785 [Prunus dulcis]|uniref:CCHC-type domain-containing protein n=1 Tax=Prunus dulcis TaxID=3755 RepID=A0AAD4ZAH6_PRUDU|nr:hypothetical protein L3X38_017785 [Prunus dulcis]
MSSFLRSSSCSSSSSRTSISRLPEIVNEEQVEFESNNSELDYRDWNIPRVPSQETYKKRWSLPSFKTTTHVKTVEQVYALGKELEVCQLLNLESIKRHKNEGNNFLHIGLVQVAVKPLTRTGLKASVLLWLRDARFTNSEDSTLGVTESSLSNGPVHFDCYPDFTFQDLKTNPSLKIKQIKPTLQKIEEMLEQLTPVKGEPSGVKVLDSINPDSDQESVQSLDSVDSNISKIEKAFTELAVEPRITRITHQVTPTSLTKNWYTRPTPPDIQFEERHFQNQFSVSSDKLYEWNIDGLSEQEVFNKLQHMSMVANSYISNHSFRQSEIVPLLVTGFTGTLRNWWDKHLTPDSKNLIIHAVKLNDEGLPIFDEQIGQGIEDGVNTLFYTIIEHFIGTPSHTTSRIHDQLSNLRCPKLSDFRWYKDVFISRVMLRDDSNQSFWKEKFINGLPNLFAHKIRTTLSNEQGHIDWNNLTYGNLVSTINQVGMKMCVDMKIGKQIQSDRKSAKYELGNFCEQYGLTSLPPSSRTKLHHKSPSRSYHNRKNRYQNNDSREFYKTKKHSPKKNWKKFLSKSKKTRFQNNSGKGKVVCWKCQKPGHYANKCKVKDTIKQLKIDEVEKENLIRLLDLKDSEPSDLESSVDSDSEKSYSSDSQPSSPHVQLGCKDNCCSPMKTISVLTKQEEQEELLIDLICKVENPELKAEYLKKFRKILSQEGPSLSPPPQKISLNTTLERFSRNRDITLHDLHSEVKLIKKEIVDLKQLSQKLQSENYEIRQDLIALKPSSSQSPTNSDDESLNPEQPYV